LYPILVIDLVFLHGFYSSPLSSKIQFLKKEIIESDIGSQIGKIIAVDLYPNPSDFEKMTVSSLLLRIDKQIKPLSNPIVLIGSSHGGLLARNYVDQYPKRVKGAVLFAPALKFYDTLKITHSDEWNEWRDHGHITVFHGAYQKDVKWSWEYIKDLIQYSNKQSRLQIPILLIHGKKDSVIPFNHSIEFADAQRSQGGQIETHYLPEGNHPLNNVFGDLRTLVINWLREKVIPQLSD